MSVSKRRRFEIFKRDAFTCAYCGNTPPRVVLEIDHIDPRSNGGTDEVRNLITSCFDCNRGKSDIPLTSVPDSLRAQAERASESAKQLKAMRKAFKREQDERKQIVQELSNAWVEAIGNNPKVWNITGDAKKTLLFFMDRMSYSEILEAIHILGSRSIPEHRAVKYFAGICWIMIREKEGK